MGVFEKRGNRSEAVIEDRLQQAPWKSMEINAVCQTAAIAPSMGILLYE